MAYHDVHSCIQLVAENEKLRKLIKKLKFENDDIKLCLQKCEEKRAQQKCTTQNIEVQTEPRGSYAYNSIIVPTWKSKKTETKAEDSDKVNRTMIMHSNLMKRYEKELRTNVDHVETITKLNIRINELEVRLKQCEIENHELKIGKQLSNTKRGGDESLLDQFHKVRKERDKLLKDKKKLQSEVKGLDKNFFEEIEDLKFALQQSAKLNKQYEKALQKLCFKFGYPYPFPEECPVKK